MQIIEYNESYKLECLRVFRSNEPHYFAQHEIRDFEQYLDRPWQNQKYFLAIDDGKVIAQGGYSFIKEAAWLDWGMVDNAYHYRGIGASLLRFRIDSILRDDPSADILMCTSQHVVDFYLKQGFSLLETIENGFGCNFNKIKLEYTRHRKRPTSSGRGRCRK